MHALDSVRPDILADLHRLAAIRASDLTARPWVTALQPLVRVATRALHTPVAQINLVTDHHQVPVVAAADPSMTTFDWSAPVGLEASFCQHVVRTGRPLLVEDARDDVRVRDSIATTKGGVVAYAGVPLRAPGEAADTDGPILGSVCVVDFRPRHWKADELQILQELSTAVTAELAVESERAALLAAERDARQAAEEASLAKSQFLTTMSHELRTPLNAIGGYAELLDLGVRGPVNAEQRSDLARIRHSQQQLLGLINDVLNFSRLENGEVHWEITDVPATALLEEVAALARPQAAARSLTFTVFACPDRDGDVIVRADREKLRQLLLNLLSNAIKFTAPEGSVTLRCETHDAFVVFEVRDTGVGIDRAQLERIFEPFVQVNAELTRVAGGSGLGLAISRDLAQGMGGELTVESAPGAGSTFRVRMGRESRVESRESRVESLE